MKKKSFIVFSIVTFVAILFVLTYSFAISEITIQPGSSIFVKPGEYVRVTCEGSNNQFKPYCLCISEQGRANLYLFTSPTEKIGLVSYYYYEDCISGMNTNPSCNY